MRHKRSDLGFCLRLSACGKEAAAEQHRRKHICSDSGTIHSHWNIVLKSRKNPTHVQHHSRLRAAANLEKREWLTTIANFVFSWLKLTLIRPQICSPQSRLHRPCPTARPRACSMTTISIVVPAYDGRPWIAELLESIRAQTYPRDRLETIVIAVDPAMPAQPLPVRSWYAMPCRDGARRCQGHAPARR